MKRSSLTLLATLAAAVPATAQDKPPEAGPQPPHRSETIDCVRTRTGYLVGTMRFEGDAIYSHSEFDNFRRSGFDLSANSLSFAMAFGITDWLMAKAIVPFRFHDYDPGGQENGIGDITLDGKLSVKKGASPIGFVPLDLAFGMAVTLPTGDEDEGLGEEEATVQPYVAASHWFLSWIGLHGSAYFEFQSGEKPYHGMAAAAELVPWARELSLLASLEARQRGTDSPAFAFIPGAEYRFSEMISAGIGFPLGLSSRAEDWGIILNAQIRF